MRRQISGPHAADHSAPDQTPDGIYLVRVQRVQFRRNGHKPYYTFALTILDPRLLAGHVISSRLYCNSKALWKLSWFLRDFGYDISLLDSDEVDETQLVGLRGVVKLGHIIRDGISMLRFDSFAPASQWTELSPGNLDGSEVA